MRMRQHGCHPGEGEDDQVLAVINTAVLPAGFIAIPFVQIGLLEPSVDRASRATAEHGQRDDKKQ